MPAKLYKYPRTQHLTGSRLQSGDEDLEQIPFAELQGKFVVIEEKCDGANAGISFTVDGQLLLQSRGHFLSGGGLGEEQFSLFKAWASAHQEILWHLIGTRYIVYGEWLYKKHTLFYDKLSHYFLEFDILDLETDDFLSTSRRREFWRDTGIISSVPVLFEGETPRRLKEVTAFIGYSSFQSTSWRDNLIQEAIVRDIDVKRVLRQTDLSGQMEGLYLKIEEDGKVAHRLKYVRWEFLNSVFAAGTHVNDYPMLPNKLRAGVDIFAP